MGFLLWQDSDRHELTPGMAQKIVARTMAIIGCNINIMDADGVIIASGDAQRIGQKHDGALLALAQGQDGRYR